jgi:alanine racemase
VHGMTARRAELAIDLAAVADNWRRVRDATAGAEVAAVLKRDAYGLGLDAVAPVLARAGCRSVFVADAGEGRRVRAAAPDAEVFLLDGDGAGPDEPLVPVIDSLEALARCRSGSVALLLDSGIGRAGLAEAEVARLAADPGRLAGRRVALVMTYLAGFTQPDDPANRAQLAAFRALAARLPPARLSAATSSFAFAGPEWRLDLVRVGSALWGVRTADVAGYDPAPVVALTAPVVAVRTLPAGAPLGYYRHRTPRAMRIATLALGYADGLPAGFTAAAAAFVDGARAPFVAEATMSLTTIDVSALPPGRPAPGDSVEIVGPHQDVNALGARLGLNPNRLLTAFGATLPRRYRHPASGDAAGAC